MDKMKKLERAVARLESRLEKAEAHGRALEKVVKAVIGEASKNAFEFAVKQYGWQELHEKHERAVREALREKEG